MLEILQSELNHIGIKIMVHYMAIWFYKLFMVRYKIKVRTR